MEAIAAGATQATHIFNAMPPLHHRKPGLAGAALDARLACELINDGRHLHAETVRMVFRLVPRPLLITDAIDAAGVGDGTFDLGGQEVYVHDGEARLVRSGSLAGSTLTMDEALREMFGAIAPGLRADLVVLDDDLRVRDVMSAGIWVEQSN
jgi:N-acetylglucosamine-6-phosphate deacetylase